MDRNTQTLVSGIVAVLTALVCGVSAYLLPHIPLVWQISGGLSLVAFATYLVLDIGYYKELLSKRTTRYGINSVVMTLIALGIVVFINMIANEYDVKADITKNKLNTLSDESVKVLKGLDMDVHMRAFVYPAQIPAFDKIFDKYTYYSPHLKKEYIDLDKDALAVKRYNIKSAGTILFESGTRNSRVENLRGADDPKLEEKLTNAIIQVAKGEKRKIYFLKGHGERALADTGRDGYSDIKESLEAGRYAVFELNLLEQDRVPADAEIVIVAGPKSEFMPHETKALEAFLQTGGKVLMMVDPESSAALQPFLAGYGVQWKPKMTIFETNKLQQLAGGNPLAPIITSYDAGHEITKDTRELTIFPVAAPVEKAANAKPDLSITSLFSSSARSMEAELAGNRLNLDQQKARKGPISMALAISGTAKDEKAAESKDAKKDEKKAEPPPPAPEQKKEKGKEFRLVVIGDSDFAANGVGRFGMNADLFQNTLAWLAEEEDLISIRPKSLDVSEFNITDARLRIINLASVAVLPLVMFLAGISVWLGRRRR